MENTSTPNALTTTALTSSTSNLDVANSRRRLLGNLGAIAAAATATVVGAGQAKAQSNQSQSSTTVA
jgi:hypothetical protein